MTKRALDERKPGIGVYGEFGNLFLHAVCYVPSHGAEIADTLEKNPRRGSGIDRERANQSSCVLPYYCKTASIDAQVVYDGPQRSIADITTLPC